MAEEQFKPADANEDGVVTRKERRQYRRQQNQSNQNEPDRDPLSAEELAQQYGFAYRILKSVPELWKLFKQAAAEGWEPAKIAAEIQASDWFSENSEYAREAALAEAAGGADWESSRQTATSMVQAAATQYGASLTPAELDALTTRYLYEGWGRREDGSRLLAQALSSDIVSRDDTLWGQSGNLQDSLMQIAEANGLSLSRKYFEGAAQSVASGLTTADDWMRDVREQAASMWPVWSQKIMSGMDASDLASGYLNVMSQEFEVPREQLRLTDPYIRQALTGVDEQGNPKPMGLWDFQMNLRRDPRWMETKGATDTISNIALDVLKTFGFVG